MKNTAWIEKITLSPDKNFPATGFLVGRIPDLELPTDRHEALLRQQPLQRKIIETLFPPKDRLTRIPFVSADQCHGSDIAIVNPPFLDTKKCNQVDGLITTHSEVILSITTADCAPVWIIEKTGRAGALIHSGKKGTALGIVSKAIDQMQEVFQIDPYDCILTIGPCIRPPCYEIDFAETIRKQAAKAGIGVIQDEKICTACHLDHYYSYRREHGKTGHMLAVLLLHNKTAVTDNG
jgi:copper oxidase (laccase) domain-containing protein